ncbi:MAG: FGGY family carbohydrate kinase [Stappiaceae bacterium]
MGPLLLGIDAGTTAVKVHVIDATGSSLVQTSQRLDYIHTADNGIEFDPEALWQQTLVAVKDALGQLENPRDVTAIASVGVGESGVLVDEDGNAICHSLAWYDERPVAQMQQLVERYGEDYLARRSGMRVTPIAGLCKLMWMRDHHAEALAGAKHWLAVSDYIAFRLCGVAATDFSLAGRTLVLDLVKACWDTDMLREQHIPVHLMPPLVDNGVPLGVIRTEISDSLGLSEDCTIVLGGHDHVVGALACGVFDNDVLMDSLGTAEALLLPTKKMIEDDVPPSYGVEQGMLRIAGEPLYFVLGGLNAGSASVEWFRKELADEADYDEICSAANDVVPGANGVLFVPHLRGLSPPQSQAGSHGAFLNIGTWTDRPHLFRAVLEGLAFDARKVAECMAGLVGRQSLPKRIFITGGSSQNELLMRLKAHVFGRTLDVLTLPQSVSLGAALLAGIGAGVFSHWREAVERVGASVFPVPPDAEQIAFYQSRYECNYLPTVNCLQPLVDLQTSNKKISANSR